MSCSEYQDFPLPESLHRKPTRKNHKWERSVIIAVRKKNMTPEEEQVLEANQNFYAALQKLSLEEMEGVWLQEDWVRCVHPGWELLEGWDAVRESWQQIFENTQFMRIVVAVQSIRVENSIAWVCCTAKISSAAAGRFDFDYLQATNIFVQQNEIWHLVHHHASHRPASQAEEGQAELVQ